MRWTSVRTINATTERVFRTVADPEEFNKAIPDGLSVEYLTGTKRGVGMKYRATRLVKGKQRGFEQLVTEFVLGERVRTLNLTGGTMWEGSFTVRGEGGKTVLTLTMDAKTDRVFARLINRLNAGNLQKALDKDMDAVKEYCEK